MVLMALNLLLIPLIKEKYTFPLSEALSRERSLREMICKELNSSSLEYGATFLRLVEEMVA